MEPHRRPRISCLASLAAGLKWLDIGCGTGAFSEIIEQTCTATEIVAIDPAAAHVAHAQARRAASRILYQVADGRSLPFEDKRFDVAGSALVLNFIPDREKAVAEMRRVVRSGGTVAAYVWDFAGRSGTSQHLSAAIAQLHGTNTAGALYADSTSQERLKSLFESAGLTDVLTRSIEIAVSYRDFDDYWESNTGFALPVASAVNRLPADPREQLKQSVKSRLPTGADGTISYIARVNAVRGIA